MPMLIEDETRAAELTRAANHLLVAEGLTGLTLRKIGRASGISPSTIVHRFGSREQLVRVMAAITARTRLADIRVRTRGEGVLAFLPVEPEDVVDARIWCAWQELWRSEDG